MTDKLIRGGLALLGLIGLQIGVWASLAPRSFYDDFPGGGRTWVAADGPYNEHLVRDFGALNLALTAVVIVALLTGARIAILCAALAWFVYSVPHLVYHARHLHVYETSDKILNLVGLGGAVVVSGAILLMAGRGQPTDDRPPGRT